jgi:hypothetical protein
MIAFLPAERDACQRSPVVAALSATSVSPLDPTASLAEPVEKVNKSPLAVNGEFAVVGILPVAIG